jgi:hypothetical protein
MSTYQKDKEQFETLYGMLCLYMYICVYVCI